MENIVLNPIQQVNIYAHNNIILFINKQLLFSTSTMRNNPHMFDVKLVTFSNRMKLCSMYFSYFKQSNKNTHL